VTFSVTILGSSSAIPTPTRFPSAHVLNVHERLFLVDCAEGTQMQLRRFHIRMNRINHIFITHLHGDHVLGLFGLISTFNLLGRKQPLHLFAPKELESVLNFNVGVFTDKLSFPVIFHPVDPNMSQLVFEDRHVSVTSLPLRHKVPTVGYLFKETPSLPNIRKDCIQQYSLGLADIVKIKNGADYIAPDGKIIPNAELTFHARLPRSFAYCSDTLYSERLVGLIRGVDLLYHEATFLDADVDLARQTGHSTALQAATAAVGAHVGKLVIGHFSSRYKNISQHLQEARNIFPETYAAEDGQVYAIPEKFG